MKKLVISINVLCLLASANVFAEQANQSIAKRFVDKLVPIIVSGGVMAWATGGESGIPVGFGIASGYATSVSVEQARLEYEKLNEEVNEYRVTGEMSPVLEQFVFELQKLNPELSSEDILNSI